MSPPCDISLRKNSVRLRASSRNRRSTLYSAADSPAVGSKLTRYSDKSLQPLISFILPSPESSLKSVAANLVNFLVYFANSLFHPEESISH